MKKFIKTVLVVTSVMFLWTGCTIQDPERVALEKAEQAALYQRAVQALNDRKFVLEASDVTFRRGESVFVNPNTNFVSLQEDNATIQLAFNTHYAGPNGIGGITVEGKASNIINTTDKKGNTYFSMSVQGINVSATVQITMVKGTHRCSAVVTPNFNNNRISFSGFLYPISESRIFKGRAF